MLAAELDAPAPVEQQPLRLRERLRPEPGPGELLIRVRACAVCRTDLHVVEGDLPPHKQPIVPGHQVVGTVEALGPDLTPDPFPRREGAILPGESERQRQDPAT